MWFVTLHWRHNDHDGVSNHQLHSCLLNRIFRRRSKKTSKLRVTCLCVGNSPGPVNSPHKGPVTRKTFPFDDVIMNVKARRRLLCIDLDMIISSYTTDTIFTIHLFGRLCIEIGLSEIDFFLNQYTSITITAVIIVKSDEIYKLFTTTVIKWHRINRLYTSPLPISVNIMTTNPLSRSISSATILAYWHKHAATKIVKVNVPRPPLTNMS